MRRGPRAADAPARDRAATVGAATLALAAFGGLCAVGTACEERETIAADEVAPAAGAFRSVAVEESAAAATRTLRTRGYEEVGEPRRAFLVEGAALTLETSLRSGSCYVALLASSDALTAATLTLHEGDGAAVARSSGVPSGDVALRFCPAHTGTYYLGVRADAGSGLVHVALLSGPSGLDVRLDDLFGPHEAPRAEGARGEREPAGAGR
jgi:hypothetical protein